MNEEIKGYTNIGVDEEGHTIGNCQKCGLHGVLINGHGCKISANNGPKLTQGDHPRVGG